MKKRISVLGCAALILLAAVLTFQLTFHFVSARYQEKLDDLTVSGADFTKLREADDLIRKNFLGQIDEGSLEDGALKGYVSGLNDAYSRYMTPEEYTVYQQSLSGAASGVGIRATQDPDSGEVVVYGVLSGSPADEANIRKGDVLYRVDDTPVSELGFYNAMKALSGAAGTKVKVSFLREVAAQRMELVFTMVRADVKVNSVSWEMLHETVGYLQIFSFDLETDEEFRAAIDALIADGAKSLIIDVRNNSGGSVDAMGRMLDLLLPRGDIFYRTGLDGKETAYPSDEHSVSLPMAVLINENTASAAELFAAVLKDEGAATLVGKTTYGKATGQRITEMEDGSALVLTYEKFRTARGESFDGKGVSPDVVSEFDGANLYLISRSKDTQLQDALKALAQQ